MKRIVLLGLVLTSCSTSPSAGMQVSDRIRLPGEAGAIAAGAGGIWVSVIDEDIVRIDPSTGAIGARIAHPREPGGAHAIAIEGNDVWFANPVGSDPPSGFDPGDDSTDVQDVYRRFRPARADLFTYSVSGNLVHVDAGSDRVAAQLAFLDYTPTSIAAVGGSAWVPTPDGLRPLDPRAHLFGSPLDVSGDRVVASAGTLWVAEDTSITRVDPATGEARALVDLAPSRDINEYVIDGAALWVTTDDALHKFDAGTGEALGTLALDRPFHLAAANGVVLVLGLFDGLLTRVDGDRLAIADQIDLGFDDLAAGIAIGGTDAWVAVGERVVRVSLTAAA